MIRYYPSFCCFMMMTLSCSGRKITQTSARASAATASMSAPDRASNTTRPSLPTREIVFPGQIRMAGRPSASTTVCIGSATNTFADPFYMTLDRDTEYSCTKRGLLLSVPVIKKRSKIQGGKKMNKTRAERFAAVRKASEDQKKENFGGIYFTDKGLSLIHI